MNQEELRKEIKDFTMEHEEDMDIMMSSIDNVRMAIRCIRAGDSDPTGAPSDKIVGHIIDFLLS